MYGHLAPLETVASNTCGGRSAHNLPDVGALFSLGWKFYTGLTPTMPCTSGYYTYSSLMTLIAIVKCFDKNGIAIQ